MAARARFSELNSPPGGRAGDVAFEAETETLLISVVLVVARRPPNLSTRSSTEIVTYTFPDESMAIL
jgi:hypothetical protein